MFEVDAARDRITRALQLVPGISRPDLIRWRERVLTSLRLYQSAARAGKMSRPVAMPEY